MSQNPYANTTSAEIVRPDAASEVELIRKRFLNHEASVQSIGTLYVLGSIFGILGSGVVLFGGISAAFAPDDPSVPPGAKVMGAVIVLSIGIAFLAISILQFWVGVGLQKLKPWTRIAGIVLAAIGLLGFPIGTLISAYFLYLLVSKKGVYVFSDEYCQIREQTPHIRYKTSIILWIFVALIVILALIAVIGLVVRV
jgi:hypothetical protein